MRPGLLTAAHSPLAPPSAAAHQKLTPPLTSTSRLITLPSTPFSIHIKPSPRIFTTICNSAKTSSKSILQSKLQNDTVSEEAPENESISVSVGSPSLKAHNVVPFRLSLSDQAFFLLAFIACTTSVAFTSLCVAAVPTLHAFGRAALSLSKLADSAREELPSTMAAVRLTGMEISDLTLELSDLSHEIADGVTKSAQAVQAAEAGVRQIGSLARQQTMSMIQERASLPIISLQPVVTGAAKKTSRAVGQATKRLMNIISGGSESEDGNTVDRIEV